MSDERTRAWEELHVPATEATRLMEIAHAHPEFADAVAAHPNVYPALTAWLAQLSSHASPAAAEPGPAHEHSAAREHSPAQEPNSGLADARVELADPAISAARLAEIAASHPELHVELAAHSRAYPDLLDWLGSRPDPGTRAAVAERRARDSAGAPAMVAESASPSGWERADSVLDKVDRAGEITRNILAAIYGIFLIIVGIAIAVLLFGKGSPTGWVGLGVAVYGAYVALPLPGYKLIVW